MVIGYQSKIVMPDEKTVAYKDYGDTWNGSD